MNLARQQGVKRQDLRQLQEELKSQAPSLENSAEFCVGLVPGGETKEKRWEHDRNMMGKRWNSQTPTNLMVYQCLSPFYPFSLVKQFVWPPSRTYPEIILVQILDTFFSDTIVFLVAQVTWIHT